MIGAKIRGRKLENIVSAKIEISLDNLCRSFSIVTTELNENGKDPIFDMAVGDPIECFVDNELVLTGFIEVLSINYTAAEARNAHNIGLRGRGRLQDIVDSTIREEYIESIDLITIIKSVLKKLNLTHVNIINKVGEIEPFKEEIQSAEIGINAFEFLQSYAQKRQLLLNEDEKGDLVIQRAARAEPGQPRERILPTLMNRRLTSENNNILSGSFEQNMTNRFRQYIYDSQLNPALQKTERTKEELVNQQDGSITDDFIRASRIVEINSSEDLSEDDVRKRAIWEKNVRRARGLNYSCMVAGHSYRSVFPIRTSCIWKANESIYVVDDFCKISSVLLLKRVVFSQDIETGSTSELTFTYNDAYTISEEGSSPPNQTVYSPNDFFMRKRT